MRMLFDIKLQKEFLNIISKYNNTDSIIIKGNIARLTKHKQSGYYAPEIAKEIGVSIYTLQEWCKLNRPNKPNFETALKLADFLEIGISEFYKNMEGSQCK